MGRYRPTNAQSFEKLASSRIHVGHPASNFYRYRGLRPHCLDEANAIKPYLCYRIKLAGYPPVRSANPVASPVPESLHQESRTKNQIAFYAPGRPIAAPICPDNSRPR